MTEAEKFLKEQYPNGGCNTHSQFDYREVVTLLNKYAQQEKQKVLDELIQVNGTRYLEGWDTKYYKWMNAVLFDMKEEILKKLKG